MPYPTESRALRWFAATALGVLLGLLIAIAWTFDLLDRRSAQPPEISNEFTGFTGVARRRRREPPRVKSEQFAARCAAPSPVYVYELARTPSYFVVVLAKSVVDRDGVADSLAKRYELMSDGYESSKRGFVAALRPSALSKLRCEPAVASIEEDRTVRDDPAAVQPGLPSRSP